MPVDAETLTNLVLAAHLAQFPLAASVTRENTMTGVPPHNPSEALIGALCESFCSVVASVQIMDLGVGTNDIPGKSVPTPFVCDTAGAKALFLAQRGWTGVSASAAMDTLVVGPLQQFSVMAKIQMKENPALGTGTGAITALSNPGLEASLGPLFLTALTQSFTACGKFGTDDVPGTPVNPVLAAHLSAFALAFAKGVGGIIAAIPYVGAGGGSPVPSPVVNTGNFV